MDVSENRDVVEPWRLKSNQVKKNSNAISNFLVMECIDMIKVVEGRIGI